MTRPTSTSSNLLFSETESCHDPQQVSIGCLADPTTFTLGGQTVDAQLYQEDNTWRDLGYADGSVSMSSGSLFPDLGEMWRLRLPEKPGLGKLY